MAWTPGPLTRAFVARLFEAEDGTGSHDLKAAFIWMGAGLAAPGFILPILLLGWDWSLIGLSRGPAILVEVSRQDRVLYVGLSIVATGAVTALVWGRLLIDRRDAIVLGALPVRPGAIVRAKIASLLIYVTALAVAMHTMAALTFGGLLSAGRLGYWMRITAAHFIAGALASLFTFLAVTAWQSVLALTLRGRALTAVSAASQAVLVGSLLMLAVSLPTIARQATDDLGDSRIFRSKWEFRIDPGLAPDAHARATIRPSLSWLPPAWFSGVYETLLGSPNGHLRSLAERGLLALGVAGLITTIGLPLAYRRVLAAAVESPVGSRGRRRGFAASERVARWVGREGEVRACLQFLGAALGRVARHRFVLAAALGASVAWMLPAAWHALEVRDGVLTASVLSVPFWLLFWISAGVRLAAALPTDPRAGWIFAGLPRVDDAGRVALRRALWTWVVAPVTSIAALFCLWRSGAPLAVAMLVTSVASGLLIVETWLLGVEGMPAASPWAPQRAVLRRYWPLYLLVLVTAAILPGAVLSYSVVGALMLDALMVLGAAAVLTFGQRIDALDRDARSADDPAFQILGLE